MKTHCSFCFNVIKNGTKLNKSYVNTNIRHLISFNTFELGKLELLANEFGKLKHGSFYSL